MMRSMRYFPSRTCPGENGASADSVTEGSTDEDYHDRQRLSLISDSLALAEAAADVAERRRLLGDVDVVARGAVRASGVAAALAEPSTKPTAGAVDAIEGGTSLEATAGWIETGAPVMEGWLSLRAKRIAPPATTASASSATEKTHRRRRGSFSRGGGSVGAVENDGTAGARRLRPEGMSRSDSDGGGGIDDGISRPGSSPLDFR